MQMFKQMYTIISSIISSTDSFTVPAFVLAKEAFSLLRRVALVQGIQLEQKPQTVTNLYNGKY